MSCHARVPERPWKTFSALRASYRSSRSTTGRRTASSSPTRSWTTSWSSPVPPGKRILPNVEPVVVDTDVASLLIKRKLPASLAGLLAGRPLVLTFVTLGELTRWVEQRQWGPHRREMLERWLAGKHVIHSDQDIACTWGTITAYA